MITVLFTIILDAAIHQLKKALSGKDIIGFVKSVIMKNLMSREVKMMKKMKVLEKIRTIKLSVLIKRSERMVSVILRPLVLLSDRKSQRMYIQCN